MEGDEGWGITDSGMAVRVLIVLISLIGLCLLADMDRRRSLGGILYSDDPSFATPAPAGTHE